MPIIEIAFGVWMFMLVLTLMFFHGCGKCRNRR